MCEDFFVNDDKSIGQDVRTFLICCYKYSVINPMSFISMYTLVVNPIDLSHISANLYVISHNE